MQELVEKLNAYHLCIGSCESLTAGLFASSIAEVSGASAVLKGGIITYQTVCKIDVVHVDEAVIAQYGVISEACAKEMAGKARSLLDVDICVSFTGNAGPQAMEGKPAGLVYCAIANAEYCECYEFHIVGERNVVRRRVVEKMANKVIEFVDTQYEKRRVIDGKR